eukprot:73644-Chlamydomonas_euryale.AAC.1
MAEQSSLKDDEAADTPHTVRIALSVLVEQASARLVEAARRPRGGDANAGADAGAAAAGLLGADGGRYVEICNASMGDLALSALQYPNTIAVTTALGHASVETSAGLLFSTAASASL